jgi:hypothetical protein
MIVEATMANGFGSDEIGYGYGMSLAKGLTSAEEDKLVEANYNKIRKILGWKEITL